MKSPNLYQVNGRWMSLEQARVARGLDKPKEEVCEGPTCPIVIEEVDDKDVPKDAVIQDEVVIEDEFEIEVELEEDIETEEVEYTLEDLKDMCDKKGIYFHHATKEKKLKELLGIKE